MRRKRGRRATDRCRGAVARFGRAGEPACIVDGAPRPAGSGQGSRTDRRGDRPGILASPAGIGGAETGSRTCICAGPARERGAAVPAGLPPDTTYLFNHALVQDAAYGTLLREPRRALHARIADTFERHFPEIAENQPELLARHCTEAGLIEKAAACGAKPAGGRWRGRRSGKPPSSSRVRSTRSQVAGHGSPAARADQAADRPVERADPHQGHASAETKASFEQARIDRAAEALGDPPTIRCFCFPSSTASGSVTAWRSRATWPANWPRSFTRWPEPERGHPG